MTLLAVKVFLKKAWIAIKNYWYIPVVAILFVIGFILLRRSPTVLGEVLKNAFESHQKEVKAIEKIHTEEIDKREKALEEYEAKVEKIEQKFKDKNIELDKKQKKEIEKLVKQSEESPDELAKKIADTWGFELHKE